MVKNILKDILYGVCVGDTLGVSAEFESRNTLKHSPITNMTSGGFHEQGLGVWSDDSSLTFCLAETIAEGFDLQLLANKFIKWKNEGYWTATGEVFDIGMTTNQSIQLLEEGISPLYSGSNNTNENGNGSIMRVLPLVLLFEGKTINERYELTKQVSGITHSHIRAINACFYYLEFAKLIVEGKNKFEASEILKTDFITFLKSKNTIQSEIDIFYRLTSINIFEVDENLIVSDGYVIHTLEASIWCLLKTNSYKEAVLKAVNLGEDTDTTGAVTGGLAGLYYSFCAIPKNWIYPLRKINEINQLIHNYQKQVNAINCSMIITYKTTTIGDAEVQSSSEDSLVNYESIHQKINAIMNLTNEIGINTLSFHFEYPDYPNKGFIDYELNSEAADNTNGFFTILYFNNINFISQEEVLFKGIMGINLPNSNEVDCFEFILDMNQKNCKELIQNCTNFVQY
jgi:ADP-ribosyl-[dinitrogen reductase] hydrolase